VLAAEPRARLVIVGFGAFRDGLQSLASALAAGDLDAARALRAEDGRELPELAAYLRDEPCGAPLDRVVWTGRLDHAELEDLLPAADALVAPSTFPESFGMVAAEAAAAGTPPVAAAHSGLAEVTQALAEALPPHASGLVSFPLDEGAVEALAGRINGWLGLAEPARGEALAALHDVAVRKWSWEGVACGVLLASAGELDQLSSPNVPPATSPEPGVGGRIPEQ
jgi:glycosyltransferase involved in cell wall biosynthesis